MKRLMILEVSQKQGYIFANRELSENIRRSNEIAYVTSSEYFERVCPELYRKENAEGAEGNYVYAGGGHTILKFPNEEAADTFARTLSRQVLTDFPEMELFLTHIAYEDSDEPQEKLLELTQTQEVKKSVRQASFHLRSPSLMRKSAEGNQTKEFQKAFTDFSEQQREMAPEGWSLKNNFQWIKRESDDNFTAIVHIDGNALGLRVAKVYEKTGSDWQKTFAKLREFSESIDMDFKNAYDGMSRDLACYLEESGEGEIYRDGKEYFLPLRQIVRAGDDICFVTEGSLGIACAVSFLQHLEEQKNKFDGESYTACAGVSLIHDKYSFREAYDLSEHLCSNAKKFASIPVEGGEKKYSAIDWHIEFGQMKEGLGDVRAEYRTEDGNYLQLRPLLVRYDETDEELKGHISNERTYGQLRHTLRQLERDMDNNILSRGKVKNLRSALRQGKVETEYALIKMQLGGKQPFKGKDCFIEEKEDGRTVSRCRIFDAIELLGHTNLWREEDYEQSKAEC